MLRASPGDCKIRKSFKISKTRALRHPPMAEGGDAGISVNSLVTADECQEHTGDHETHAASLRSKKRSTAEMLEHSKQDLAKIEGKDVSKLDSHLGQMTLSNGKRLVYKSSGDGGNFSCFHPCTEILSSIPRFPALDPRRQISNKSFKRRT